MHRRILLVSVAALLAAASTGAGAQAYPSKPVRLIVPFAAGGTTDIVARVVAEKINAHSRPDADRRQQGRRRRLGRRHRDRARRARRLHARHGDGLDHRRQPGDQPEDPVQPAHRLHADHQRRGDAQRHRRQPELPGQGLQGLPRRAEEEPRQVLVRELGNGRHRPPADRAVQEPLGHLPHPHPVPRRRPGAQRRRRRPGADHLRQPAVGAALHQGRPAGRDRRRRAAAPRGAAERADLQGGRPRAGQPAGVLRHLRAEGACRRRSSTRSTTR